MDGLAELLNKLSVEDVSKLRMLFSFGSEEHVKEIVTLRVFCDEYLNFIRNNRSKNYSVSVDCSLKQLVKYFSAQKAINSISLKETELFVSNLQQTVKKGFRVYYRTLKAAFNKAIDWSYVKENHFIKVKLPKKQKVNPAFIDERQLHLICEKIDVDVVRDISILGFYTGMRLHELVNLTWRNVNLTALIITVGDEDFTTKGRNQRYIPICEEAENVLTRLTKNSHLSLSHSATLRHRSVSTADKSSFAGEKANDCHSSLKDSRGISLNKVGAMDGGIETPTLILPLKKGKEMKYVFCKKNGSKYCGNYVSRKYKKACIAAGVDESIHFHSLRHSFASSLVQKSVSLYTIKELLGHSSISTTEIYSHLNMDSLKEAIKKLDAHPPSGSSVEKIIVVNGPTPCVPLRHGAQVPGGETDMVKIFQINTGG